MSRRRVGLTPAVRCDGETNEAANLSNNFLQPFIRLSKLRLLSRKRRSVAADQPAFRPPAFRNREDRFALDSNRILPAPDTVPKSFSTVFSSRPPSLYCPACRPLFCRDSNRQIAPSFWSAATARGSDCRGHLTAFAPASEVVALPPNLLRWT